MSVGSLDIIIGCMKAGKTSHLIKELTIYHQLGFKVLYVNHVLDTRGEHFSTHNPSLNEKIIMDHKKVETLESFETLFDEYEVIGIDETQFFKNIKPVILNLVEKLGKRVILSGLSGDFHRNVFGEIFELIPYCDKLTKLSSFCQRCCVKKIVRDAHFSLKIKETNSDVGFDNYVPVCRSCFLTTSTN